MLRRHEPQDYAFLPDIDAPGVGALTDDDRRCLDELGDYVVRAGAHERFGATLLHRHFAVERGEIFVEEVDAKEEALKLRPMRDAAPDLVAVNVCFEEAERPADEIRLIGLEFTAPAALGEVAAIDDADHGLLSGVDKILARHGKSRRFGLRLIHDPLNANGRVLIETCDLAKRVLTNTIAEADDPDLSRSIPTVFRWEAASQRDENGLIVAQECVQWCKTVRVCLSAIGSGHDQSESHDSTHPEGPQ
jgi:hypothetical protein